MDGLWLRGFYLFVQAQYHPENDPNADKSLKHQGKLADAMKVLGIPFKGVGDLGNIGNGNYAPEGVSALKNFVIIKYSDQR